MFPLKILKFETCKQKRGSHNASPTPRLYFGRGPPDKSLSCRSSTSSNTATNTFISRILSLASPDLPGTGSPDSHDGGKFRGRQPIYPRLATDRPRRRELRGTVWRRSAGAAVWPGRPRSTGSPTRSVRNPGSTREKTGGGGEGTGGKSRIFCNLFGFVFLVGSADRERHLYRTVCRLSPLRADTVL